MKTAILSLVILVVASSGCFLPSTKLGRAFDRTDKIKGAIDADRERERSIAQQFTYAADVALKLDPLPSRFSRVAADMTHRSILAGGVPSAEEATRLREMVSGLTSTNASNLKAGGKILDDLERKLESVQRHSEELGIQLEAARASERDVSRKNAELADRMVKIMRVIWLLVAGVVAMGIAWLATIIIPIFFPAVMPIFGTMKRLVRGIQEYRKDPSPDADINNVLERVLDEKDRWRIKKIKRDLVGP